MRTLRLTIRWGVIFQPWCRWRGHRWVKVRDFHGLGGQVCSRCGFYEPFIMPYAVYKDGELIKEYP